MRLAEAEQKDKLEIISITDSRVQTQAFRFGIAEGAYVRCKEKIPRGPIIINKNLQEIAIGRELAEGIKVRLI